MKDLLKNYHISRNLSDFFENNLVTIDFNSPNSIINFSQILLSIDDDNRSVSFAKEFFSLLDISLDLNRDDIKRDAVGIIASNIAVKLFNLKYHKEALDWINRAISEDNRRLIFFLNKAVILSAIGEINALISLVGFVNDARDQYLDYSSEIHNQLLQLRNSVISSKENFDKVSKNLGNFDSINQKAETIYLYACCFNEAAILPFFLDYYSNFVGVEKFFIFDGGSSDGSLDILHQYNVEIISEKHEQLNDLTLMNFRNNYYKNYRNDCDWTIVCDLDEFLWHPNLKQRLRLMSAEGVTIPRIEGYSMISLDLPDYEKGLYLPNQVRKGIPDPHSCNKNIIFKPQLDINYAIGCHQCEPTGNVVFSTEYEFKNLHYQNLSFLHTIRKSESQYNRLSDWNRNVKAGVHYDYLRRQKLTKYLDKWNLAKEVI